MIYKLPTRKKAVDIEFPDTDFRLDQPEAPEQKGVIQGRIAQSIEEWYIAQALWNLNKPFQYQVPFFGGNRVPGGYVVDFIVTEPAAIPIEVVGPYWHQNDEQERFREARLEAALQTEMNYISTDLLVSYEEALQQVRDILYG